jgi:hypothetical protein
VVCFLFLQKIELSWLLITLLSGYTIGALCLLSKYKGTEAGPGPALDLPAHHPGMT